MRSTSRIRNVWKGWYHSRSQWVWGTRWTTVRERFGIAAGPPAVAGRVTSRDVIAGEYIDRSVARLEG
jgi:hypothetical protein